MRNSKGQVQALGPAIIILVIAAVFLILGLVVMQELRDTDIVKKANTWTVSNETLTTVTETGELVATYTARGFNSLTVAIVTNATGGEVIPSTNYSVNSASGRISFTAGLYNNTNWNVSYSYMTGDEAYGGANGTLQGVATFADFWEIIVLAVVVMVVISLLIAVFGGSRER